MNTAMKIEQKFEEYLQRFFYKTMNKTIPVIDPDETQETVKPVDLLATHSEPVVVKQEDPKDIKRRARAALSNRSDSQRVVDRYIKENKKELLARRHELSAEQNEAIDNFLRLELLADKNV